MSVAWVGAGIAAVGVAATVASSNAASSAAKNAANQSATAAQNATQLQGTIYDTNRADQTPWRVGGQSALQKLLGGMGIDTPVNSATPETRAQIYNRLMPNYTQNIPGANQPVTQQYGTLGFLQGITPVAPQTTIDNSALNAEVDAEFAKQGQPGAMVARDGNFGTLAHNFGMEDYQADPGYAFRMQQGQQALERSAAARGGLYSGRAAKDLTAYSQGQASQEYQNAYNRYQSNQTNQFNRLATLAGVGQTANNALQSSGQNYANQVGNISMTNAANQGNAGLAAANASTSGYAGLAKSLGSVNWGSLTGSSNNTGYGSGYDPNTGLGNTSVNYGY